MLLLILQPHPRTGGLHEDIVNDYASLLENPKFSDGVERRDFLKAALGSGFALAALPVVAQSVIKTDAAGLTAGTVALPSPARPCQSTAPSLPARQTCR